MAPSEQEFQFVSIANPKEAQSRSFQRSVRSHAVRQGLHKKRQQEQSAGQNFRIAPLTEDRATQVDAQSLSSIPTLSEFRLNERDSPAHYTKLRALFSSGMPHFALSPCRHGAQSDEPQTKSSRLSSQYSALETMWPSRPSALFSAQA